MNTPIDFLVVGAQKAGTTALYKYLKQHPQVGLANRKEVHFFDKDHHFVGGSVNYDPYHAMFPPAQRGKLRGEVTPIYIYWRPAMERIWQYNPNIRLIMLLRNPVERAFSHWNMEVGRNWDSLPFYEALKNERTRCRQALPHQHRVYSYIDRGFYTEQIRRIWSFFPKEQVLILRSESLANKPEPTLREMCEFLEIDEGYYSRIKHLTAHVGDYQHTMDPSAQDFLRNIFEHEIRQLERMLCWDLSSWLD